MHTYSNANMSQISPVTLEGLISHVQSIRTSKYRQNVIAFANDRRLYPLPNRCDARDWFASVTSIQPSRQSLKSIRSESF